MNVEYFLTLELYEISLILNILVIVTLKLYIHVGITEFGF